jgi:hypothetical protein
MAEALLRLLVRPVDGHFARLDRCEGFIVGVIRDGAGTAGVWIDRGTCGEVRSEKGEHRLFHQRNGVFASVGAWGTPGRYLFVVRSAILGAGSGRETPEMEDQEVNSRH